MITTKLFDAVDATIQKISDVVEIDQNYKQSLQIEKTGTDGSPQLYLEVSNGDAAGASGPWIPIPDEGPPSRDFFLLDATPFFITDINDLTFKYFRLRMEANDNTTGTVTIVQAIKEQV